MKWIKFLLMLIIQLPISVFYYLDPTNPIYFLIFQFGITLFIFLMDNAISFNYNNIQAMNENFEELLEKILKVVPKNPVAKNDDIDGEI